MQEITKSKIAKIMIDKLDLEWTLQLEKEAIDEIDNYISEYNEYSSITFE